MDIRFISSLPWDDEVRIAGGLLSAVAKLLDELPIAYSLRIETAGGRTFDHTHWPGQADLPGTAEMAGVRTLEAQRAAAEVRARLG